MANDLIQNKKQITAIYYDFLAQLYLLNHKQQQIISDYVKKLEQKKLKEVKAKIAAK